MLPGGAEKNLKITIQMLMAGAGAKQAQTALDGVANSSKKAGGEVAKAKASLKDMGAGLQKLGAAAASIGAVVGVAINSFVAQNKYTNAAAAAWDDQTRSLKKSYNEIGGTLTEMFLPAMVKIAEVAQTVADIIKGISDNQTIPKLGVIIEYYTRKAQDVLAGNTEASDSYAAYLKEIYGDGAKTYTGHGATQRVTTPGGSPIAKPGEVLYDKPEVMKVWIEYQRQETQATNQFILQQQKAARDYRRQETIAYTDFQRQHDIAVRDYNRQQGLAEQDYYRQRRLAARDFNIEIARSEQDRQKSIRRASEDHNYRLFQIIRDGDAMAYWQEQYNYNKEQSRADEDFSIEQRRKREDYAKTQADEAEQFNIERNRAAEEFTIKQNDAATAFNVERQRAYEQFILQQGDARLQFDTEQAQRKQNFIWSLSQFANEETQIATLRAQFTAASLQQMNTMYNQYLSGQPIQMPQFNNPYSAYQSGGINGGGNMTQNNTFNPGMRPEDVIQVQGMAQQMLNYAFGGQ